MKNLDLASAIAFVFIVVTPAFAWWTSGICAVLAGLNLIAYALRLHEANKYEDWY